MLRFETLWNNFPDAEEMRRKCVNKQKTAADPFDNYCAILLSECLLRSGVMLDRCPGTKCWSHAAPRHVIRAEELAGWLSKSPPAGFGRRREVDPQKFQEQLSGRTGVVFFKDYWTRRNERPEGRSGDHIDLWKYNRITGGSMVYRAVIEFFGLVSDLNRSREVWFWEVK